MGWGDTVGNPVGKEGEKLRVTEFPGETECLDGGQRP